MFATNHLGPFLLTNLLDPLRAATPGRVLTLTAPSTVPLDFDDLQGERSSSRCAPAPSLDPSGIPDALDLVDGECGARGGGEVSHVGFVRCHDRRLPGPGDQHDRRIHDVRCLRGGAQ